MNYHGPSTQGRLRQPWALLRNAFGVLGSDLWVRLSLGGTPEQINCWVAIATRGRGEVDQPSICTLRSKADTLQNFRTRHTLVFIHRILRLKLRRREIGELF